MKRFFRFLLLLFSFSFLSFFSNAFMTSLLDQRNWTLASDMSVWMNLAQESTALFVAKSNNYPAFNNAIGNELNYNLSVRFATKQKTFVCSYPDRKEKPFQLIELDSLSSPIICMNSWSGSSSFTVSEFGTTMFGNIKESLLINDNQIYITKATADRLIKARSLAPGSYQSLLAEPLPVVLIKNGIEKTKQFEIIDIIIKTNFEWLEKLYGENYVVAGYNAANNVICDNLAVHCVLENDIFSNAYYFDHALPVFKQLIGNDMGFASVDSLILSFNNPLNEIFNKIQGSETVSILPQIIGFGAATIFIGVFVILYFSRKNICCTKPTTFLTIELSGILIGVVLSELCWTFIYSSTVAVFSPIGVILGVLIAAAIICYMHFSKSNATKI